MIRRVVNLPVTVQALISYTLELEGDTEEDIQNQLLDTEMMNHSEIYALSVGEPVVELVDQVLAVHLWSDTGLEVAAEV